MSNEEIDEAVQQCKKDMFSMRIKFAKREVRARFVPRLGGASRGAQCPITCCCSGSCRWTQPGLSPEPSAAGCCQP